MEGSSSRSVPSRCWGRGKPSSATGAPAPVHSLASDLLCTIFALLGHLDLARCSVVCKFWNNIIYSSTLMRELYYKRNPPIMSNLMMENPLEISMKMHLEGLAMREHRFALVSGCPEIHQWCGHSFRVALCRMKRGLILTGAGDKILRLWSAESCKCLDEYYLPNMSQLVDYDFDENKIVGLSRSQISILKRNGRRSSIQSRDGIFTRGLCMRYLDPTAAIGCEDGSTRIFDMYGESWSRIIRMHAGPITCLALTDEHLVLGGSTFGTVAVADYSTGDLLAVLKSSFGHTGMKSLNFNMHSYLLFAGSSSGYAHCWDLRTLKPIWERRVCPNAIYATHHLWSDASMLAVGGVDGVLRILSQNTGETLSSFVMDPGSGVPASYSNPEFIKKWKVKALPEDASIDRIPRFSRPCITCLAVGMKKIVTTHNEKYIRIWRFH